MQSEGEDQLYAGSTFAIPFVEGVIGPEEFVEKYPARALALAYLEANQDGISQDEQARIMRWFSMMDRLNEYVLLHKQGEFEILYEQQLGVFEDLLHFLEQSSFDCPKGYISLPTGSGKTILFGEFVKATRLRTLILVPTKKLVHQTEEKMKTIGESEGLDIGKLFGDTKETESLVTISTYASFVKQNKEGSDSLIKPEDYDVIILDEAHHAMAHGTRTALSKFDHAIQIGFTATPDYSQQRQLKNLLPVEIHAISIIEAIDLGIISPYMSLLVQTDVDLSAVSLTTTGQYDEKELEAALNIFERNRAAAEIYIKNFRGRRAIFYCAGVQHAIEMAAELNNMGIRAAAIHGNTPKRIQKNIFSQLETPLEDGGLEVICNDRILGEGFDEPTISVVFNLRPTLSLVREQQRTGRALRIDSTWPDKITAIVEFIDKKYRRNPILFADPSVTGLAMYPASQDTPEYLGSSLTELITDPLEIQSLAQRFNESRKTPIVPDGWIHVNAVAAKLEVNNVKVYDALRKLQKELPEDAPEITGRYSNPDNGRTATYFDPNVIEALEPHIERVQVAETGWMSAKQAAAVYNVGYQTLYHALRYAARENPDGYGTRRRSLEDSTRSTYFSPDIIKAALEELKVEYFSGGIPPSWFTEEELMAQIPRNVYKSVMVQLGYKHAFIKHNRGEFEVDGEKRTYFSPEFLRTIIDHSHRGYVDVSVHEIIAQTGATRSEVLAIANGMVESGKLHLGYGMRYCLIGGKSVLHFHRSDAENIIKLIGSQPTEDVEELKPRTKKVKSKPKSTATTSQTSTRRVTDTSKPKTSAPQKLRPDTSILLNSFRKFRR